MRIRFSAILCLFLAAAPAAAAGAPYYRAVPVSQPSEAKIVTRGTLWSCDDTGCVAGRGGARASIMCELVAREVGALSSFSAGGKTLDAEALADCNASAD